MASLRGASDFLDRIRRLIRFYPRLARGGLDRHQLQDLARRVARRAGYALDVAYQPWPWPGTTQVIGQTIAITIDDRRHPYEQLRSLAHEVGHLCLGHLREDDFWTDIDGPRLRDEDDWAEAFAAIVIDRVVPPSVYLGREQFELEL